MLTPFEEVMRNWSMMCDEMSKHGKCHPYKGGCPLYNNKGCEAVYRRRSEDINYTEVEQVVQKWAERKQEPVYPTWTAYLKTIGVLPYWSGHEILDKTHIPADIAEKLGVKPK